MQSNLALDPLGERGIKRLVGRAQIDQRAMVDGGRGGHRETPRIHDDQDIDALGGLVRAAPRPA
jgi:hypothetical protein